MSKNHEIRINQIWTTKEGRELSSPFGSSFDILSSDNRFFKIIHAVPKKRNYWFIQISEKYDGNYEGKHSLHAAELNKRFNLVFDPFESEMKMKDYHKPTRRLSRILED